MYSNKKVTRQLQEYHASFRDPTVDDLQYISDIWAGEIMRSERMTTLFEGNADNEHAIALQLSLDGVRAHKTGKNEV